jgi:heme ABC exporter ATP-binding subunit CcmA
VTSAPLLLQAEAVSRRYGRTWAVRNLDLSVHAGELWVVVGHNGAGKSTLLRLLGGVLRPSEGQVLAFGEDLGRLRNWGLVRQKLAFLGHEPFVYPELTGRENLHFLAELFRQSADDTRLAAILETVGLTLAADRLVHTYSRGMVQRLALARIMAQDAQCWLLDEPMTGLDPEGRQFFLELVAKGVAAGKAVVVVTHAPGSFKGLAHRLLRLENGRLATDEMRGAPS